MDIKIDDGALKGFNQKAKDEVVKASKSFIDDLIRESNRIESARSSTSGDPEITSSMVNDAAVFIRRGLFQPTKGLGIRLLRVAAAVLALVAGIMYDSTKLQESTYMVLFILIVAAAILTVTISAIKE